LNDNHSLSVDLLGGSLLLFDDHVDRGVVPDNNAVSRIAVSADYDLGVGCGIPHVTIRAPVGIGSYGDGDGAHE
jgi:hypothetical protein